MQRSTGTKRTGSAKSAGRSNVNSSGKRRFPYFVMCVDNRGYEGSLWIGKVYKVIKPDVNDLPSDLRVIDEEGEDYLYSGRRFVPVVVPPKGRRALAAAAQ